MSQVIADRRDVDFVLHEQLNISQLSKNDAFKEFNKNTIDLVINEARNLSIKEILPTLEDGDKNGCKFEKGNVIVPESFKKAYKLFVEGEWLAMTESSEYGGQEMPRSLAIAASDYFNGANYSLMMYPGLTHGAALLIESFGNDKQKKKFLKKMFSGKWTGTMLLTESDAGSDLGLLTSTAIKNDDGTYSITGNKIFISSGDHNLTENIIHPVLARIEGAPDGIKGISLFLVPKFRINDNGSLDKHNDVVCTGIENKMGIHGNATCSLTLGGQNKCRGELLGKENNGMKMMFLMMNEARLLVGMQGFCCASASYLNALKYAKERIQGKNINEITKKNAPSVAIINHPDIKRMLLSMKSHIEGMRSLLYYTSYLTDKITVTKDKKEKIKYQGIIDLLIPICKGYVTDKAFEICNNGVQIFGGYGYTKEYPQEQYVRDCRITMIYEGTNGIQSMDLLGRKLGMNGGEFVLHLMVEIQNIIKKSKKINNLTKFSKKVELCLNRFGEIAIKLGKKAQSPEIDVAFSFAYPFMEVFGDIIISWMLLWRATIASEKLESGAKKQDIQFYKGQIASLKYFATTVLPITIGKMDSIFECDDTIAQMSEDLFGCK